MRTSRSSIIVLAAAVLLCARFTPGQEPRGEPKTAEQLLGTWKVISTKIGGRELRFPQGSTTLKHITPAQYLWVVYDAEGHVQMAAGGTYTVKGDVYTELPVYGLSQEFDNTKGKPASFKCTIVGDRWTQDGRLASGQTFVQILERVKAGQ